MAAAETAATAATGAAAAALPAMAASWPPGIVIIAALIGGMASVWLETQHEIVVTWRWLAGAAVHIAISASAGVAGSAIAVAVLPKYDITAPLAAAPQWSFAGVIAALIFKVGPLAWERAKRHLAGGAAPSNPGGGNG